MKTNFICFVILFSIALNLHAEDGHKLWLRGQSSGPVNIVCSNSSATLDIAKQELNQFWQGKSGATITLKIKSDKSNKDDGWHTWSWARLQAQNGKSKVYFYYFDQHPDFPKDSPQAGHGSPHGQDVGFVFQHLNPSDTYASTTDPKISEAMATYWTNFAKYGNPNGEGVPEWEAFSDANPKVMYFNQKPYMGSVPSEESLKVLDEYFKWRRTTEGEAWAK